MKKFNKLVVAFGATILFAVGMVGGAQAYSIDTTYQLGANEGSSQVATNGKIVIHSTANMDATAVNNAKFEKSTWSSNAAYVHYIVGDYGKVYQVGQPGYVAWGAGANINWQSPVQIELDETSDYNRFKSDYATLIELVKNSASTYGIQRTLNPAYGLNGVVTHNYVSQVYGGTDHTDPTGYLAGKGVSTAQLAQDVANGYSSLGQANGGGSTTTPTEPTKPATSNIPAGFTPENGTFINGDTEIMNRVGAASFNAAQGGYLPAYTSWKYDSWKRVGNYVMIHHVYNGVHVFLPVRQGTVAWGTFK